MYPGWYTVVYTGRCIPTRVQGEYTHQGTEEYTHQGAQGVLYPPGCTGRTTPTGVHERTIPTGVHERTIPTRVPQGVLYPPGCLMVYITHLRSMVGCTLPT